MINYFRHNAHIHTRTYTQAGHPPKHCHLLICCNLSHQWFLWGSTVFTTRR